MEKIRVLEEELRSEREDNITSWVLKEDIPAGSEITADMLTAVSIPLDAKPEDLVSKDEAVGKFTKIAIKKNTPLVSSMLFEEGIIPDDLREVEYQMIHLPSDLQVNDFVDIRISFPTGHNFIVQSKKKIDKLMGANVWYRINEEELLLMESAIVDAYLQDAIIYAVKYVEPYIQDPAIVNYTPNEHVIDLIKSNPNIVKIATQYLEKKVRQDFERSLASVSEADRAQFSNNARQQMVNTRTSTTTASSQTEPRTNQYDLVSVPTTDEVDLNEEDVFSNLP